MLMLMIMAACSEPEIDLTPPGAPPAERAQAIDADLQAAHQAWLDADRDQANLIAARAYTEHFEPMEPLLREQDALRTLMLEFRFGQLIEAVQKEDAAGEVTLNVGLLRQGVAELVAATDPSSSVSVPPTPVEQAQDGEKSQ
jgi:cellobiose-specific phosphotransferase system component IIA